VSLESGQVRSLRMELGATQSELAGMMDVTRATVANWESGRAICSGAAARLLAVLVDNFRKKENDGE